MLPLDQLVNNIEISSQLPKLQVLLIDQYVFDASKILTSTNYLVYFLLYIRFKLCPFFFDTLKDLGYAFDKMRIVIDV